MHEQPPLASPSSGEGQEAQTSRRRWVPLQTMEGTFQPGNELPAAFSSRVYRDEELFEWVIIGGGVQGTYLSHLLLRRFGLPPESIRVIDPYDEPLHRWKRFAENVGMSSLRSPAVHHLDLASLSLKRFAPKAAGGKGGAADDGAGDEGAPVPAFLPPYGRPSLRLFNLHSDEVVRRNSLDQVRLKGAVCGLKLTSGGFEICYVSEADPEVRIAARRVLIAIGMSDHPSWPEWARGVRRAGGPIFHIFDPRFSLAALGTVESAVVFGGGLSAAQVALVLARRRPGAVTLVTRHEFRVHLFDSEPSWQGPNFMRAFASERAPAKRRAIIDRERHRGSLTPEAMAELEAACGSGAIRLVRIAGEPLVKVRPQGGIRFEGGGAVVEAEVMVLATGYERRRPGGEWLDTAVAELGLPCAPCGFPIIGPSLQWRPGLFVAGPLAELELGPVARNISGAHRAAARLEYFLLEQTGGEP